MKKNESLPSGDLSSSAACYVTSTLLGGQYNSHFTDEKLELVKGQTARNL